MSSKIKDFVRFIIFLGAGVGILAWIFSRQNRMYQADCDIKGIAPEDCSLWVKLQMDFLSVEVFWIVLVLLAFMVSNLSRAHRWQMLMNGIGIQAHYGNAFWTIMFGYMANLAVPRIGEVLRGTMLARYEQQPVEKVLGTIVVDRAVDVISLLFALVLAFTLQYNVIYGFLVDNFGESRLSGPLIWQLPLLGVIFLAVLWMLRRRIMATGLFKRFRSVIMGFIEGLKSIRKVSNIPLFILHTVIIWLMYYGMLILCFKSFDPTSELGLLPGLMVFVFGGLGIVFPSPGGMGTYHAMVMAGLALYGIAGDDAFSFANILYFSVQIFCNLLFGLLALVILPIFNRKTHETGTTDHELEPGQTGD